MAQCTHTCSVCLQRWERGEEREEGWERERRGEGERAEGEMEHKHGTRNEIKEGGEEIWYQ